MPVTRLLDDKTTIYKTISQMRNREQLHPYLFGYFVQSSSCSLPQQRKRRRYLQDQSVQWSAESRRTVGAARAWYHSLQDCTIFYGFYAFWTESRTLTGFSSYQRIRSQLMERTHSVNKRPGSTALILILGPCVEARHFIR